MEIQTPKSGIFSGSFLVSIKNISKKVSVKSEMIVKKGKEGLSK